MKGNELAPIIETHGDRQIVQDAFLKESLSLADRYSAEYAAASMIKEEGLDRTVKTYRKRHLDRIIGGKVAEFVADYDLDRLVHLRELNERDLRDYIEARLAPDKKDLLPQYLAFFKKTTSVARARIDYQAMDRYVQAREELIASDDESLFFVDRQGRRRRLAGAALVAKKASFVRKEEFKDEERLPTFAQILIREIESETIILGQEIKARMAEVAPEKTDLRQKIVEMFSQFTEKVMFFRLTKARALAGATLSLFGLFGMNFYSEFVSPPVVQALSNKDYVNGLKEVDFERLELGGVAVEPEVKPSIETVEPVVEPSATPSPTVSPTPQPTEEPTLEPSPTATTEPTEEPSTPTVEIPVESGPTEEEILQKVKEQERKKKEESEKEFSIYSAIESVVVEKRAQRAKEDPDYIRRINPELNENRINFLMLGLDLREGGKVSRADTILVVSFDLDTNKADLIRFPRDLHAPEVDDLSTNYQDYAFRINAVTVFGDANDARRVVENATGLSQDFCFVWDFEGFEAIVNLLGGVDLEIDATFIKRYGSEFIEKGLELKEGTNHFNAEQALWFARVRKMDTDFLRGQRQQQVAEATARELLHQLKENPAFILKFLGSFSGLQEKGSLQIAGEFSLIDLLKLSADLAKHPREIGEIQMPDIRNHDFWKQVARSGVHIKDKYQYYVIGQSVIDPDDPLDYWRAVREAVLEAWKQNFFSE